MKVIHIILSISRLSGGPSRLDQVLVETGCGAILLTSVCLRQPYLRRIVQ